MFFYSLFFIVKIVMKKIKEGIMKKSRFLSLALAGLMLVGCQPKKAEEKKEEKKGKKQYIGSGEA